MIDNIGNGIVALESRMNDLIEFLEAHRAETAEAFDGLCLNMKSIAAAKDMDLIKAIAEVRAMLGEPAQLRQAAE